jgi:hypothetical protein
MCKLLPLLKVISTRIYTSFTKTVTVLYNATVGVNEGVSWLTYCRLTGRAMSLRVLSETQRGNLLFGQLINNQYEYISGPSCWFFFKSSSSTYSGFPISVSRFCNFFWSHIWDTTVGRTPLDEGSARRRGLCLTTTQHSQETNIHTPGGIRTHDPSKRAAENPRLRPRDHWIGLVEL